MHSNSTILLSTSLLSTSDAESLLKSVHFFCIGNNRDGEVDNKCQPVIEDYVFFLYMFFLLYLPQLTVLCYWCQCLYLITRLLQALNESLKMQIFNATMHSSNYNINSCYLLLTWLCEEWDVTYESLQSYGQVFFLQETNLKQKLWHIKKSKIVQYNSYIMLLSYSGVHCLWDH